MENYLQDFHNYVTEAVEKFYFTQLNNLKAAADLIAESIIKSGKFFVTGTGHSHMIAEEFYARAGGFGNVYPILPSEFMLHEHPLKSTAVERVTDYAGVIMKIYKIKQEDVMLIASNSGRNGMIVELARLVQEQGAKVIALTNPRKPENERSRHPGGKYLYEYADVVIDNCTGAGDAVFYVEEAGTCMGALSTITGAYGAQFISVLLSKKLASRGMIPPVFKSSNMDGGDEWNRALFEKYYGV